MTNTIVNNWNLVKVNNKQLCITCFEEDRYTPKTFTKEMEETVVSIISFSDTVEGTIELPQHHCVIQYHRFS